jgi:uncharacterized protein
VYETDGINYDSARPREELVTDYESLHDGIDGVFDDSAPIVLVTYDAPVSYQQVNPVEAAITQSIVAAHSNSESSGVVTPHNAQRSRLQALLNDDLDSESAENHVDGVSTETLIETVERFQGGEQDLMVLSATVSDPRFIDAESDFLLEQNRANVSLTRHRNKMVVVAPDTIFAHIPSDPDLYSESRLWKSLAVVSGEAPSKHQTQWSGSLDEFVTDNTAVQDIEFDPSTASVDVYQVTELPDTLF